MPHVWVDLICCSHACQPSPCFQLSQIWLPEHDARNMSSNVRTWHMGCIELWCYFHFEIQGLNTTAIIVMVGIPVSLHGHVARMQTSAIPLHKTNFVEFELGCATTQHQDNWHNTVWKRFTHYKLSHTIFCLTLYGIAVFQSNLNCFSNWQFIPRSWNNCGHIWLPSAKLNNVADSWCFKHLCVTSCHMQFTVLQVVP